MKATLIFLSSFFHWLRAAQRNIFLYKHRIHFVAADENQHPSKKAKNLYVVFSEVIFHADRMHPQHKHIFNSHLHKKNTSANNRAKIKSSWTSVSEYIGIIEMKPLSHALC